MRGNALFNLKAFVSSLHAVVQEGDYRSKVVATQPNTGSRKEMSLLDRKFGR
jgi:hypothetical protein